MSSKTVPVNRTNIGFFIITVLIICSIGYLPALLDSYSIINLNPVLIYIFVLIGGSSPTIAAIISSNRLLGKNGPDIIFKKFTFRNVPRWITFISPILPVILRLTVLILYDVGGNTVNWSEINYIELIPAFFAVMIYNVWEEFGWRGYLLPSCQSNYSPFISSIITGGVATLWHWPLLAMRNGDMLTNYGNLFNFTAVVICGSMIYTYFYNASGGSILPATFYHASINASGIIFFTETGLSAFLSDYIFIVGVAAGLTVLLLTRGKLRPQNSNPIDLETLRREFDIGYSEAERIVDIKSNM